MLRWRRASVSFATTNGLGKASPIRGSALSQRFFGASPGLPASPQGTAPAEGRSVDEKRDNSADDRSDQSRWAEHSLATIEQIAEEPTDQRADEPERKGPQHAHGISPRNQQDRKSTRLNSSHITISYAVFCLKKKKHKR